MKYMTRARLPTLDYGNHSVSIGMGDTDAIETFLANAFRTIVQLTMAFTLHTVMWMRTGGARCPHPLGLYCKMSWQSGELAPPGAPTYAALALKGTTHFLD